MRRLLSSVTFSLVILLTSNGYSQPPQVFFKDTTVKVTHYELASGIFQKSVERSVPMKIIFDFVTQYLQLYQEVIVDNKAIYHASRVLSISYIISDIQCAANKHQIRVLGSEWLDFCTYKDRMYVDATLSCTLDKWGWIETASLTGGVVKGMSEDELYEISLPRIELERSTVIYYP